MILTSVFYAPPARTPQRSIQRVNAVGGADDDNLSPGVQPIHQRQERAHDAVVDLVLLAAAHLPAKQTRFGSGQEFYQRVWCAFRCLVCCVT